MILVVMSSLSDPGISSDEKLLSPIFDRGPHTLAESATPSKEEQLGET